MAGRLPNRFREGMQLSDLSATDMSDWLDLTNQLARQVEDLERAFTPETTSLQMTCVITSLTATRDGQDVPDALTVQRVHYQHTPPQACVEASCAIVREERDIVAYPDYGLKTEDYDDDLTEDGPLTVETIYLKAHHEGGTWRLQRPSAESGGENMRFVRVVSVLNENTIKVQPVKLDDEGEIVNDGEELIALAWLGYFGFWYEELAQFGGSAGDSLFLPMVMIDGAWHVMMVLPLHIDRPTSGVRNSGCTS